MRLAARTEAAPEEVQAHQRERPGGRFRSAAGAAGDQRERRAELRRSCMPLQGGEVPSRRPAPPNRRLVEAQLAKTAGPRPENGGTGPIGPPTANLTAAEAPLLAHVAVMAVLSLPTALWPGGCLGFRRATLEPTVELRDWRKTTSMSR